MTRNKELKSTTIHIETQSWEELVLHAKKWKSDGSKNYQNESDLISKLLIRDNEKKINYERFKMGTKKPKELILSEEALAIYNKIPKGNKYYKVNALLRTWLKNNKTKST